MSGHAEILSGSVLKNLTPHSVKQIFFLFTMRTRTSVAFQPCVTPGGVHGVKMGQEIIFSKKVVWKHPFWRTRKTIFWWIQLLGLSNLGKSNVGSFQSGHFNVGAFNFWKILEYLGQFDVGAIESWKIWCLLNIEETVSKYWFYSNITSFFDDQLWWSLYCSHSLVRADRAASTIKKDFFRIQSKGQ